MNLFVAVAVLITLTQAHMPEEHFGEKLKNLMDKISKICRQQADIPQSTFDQLRSGQFPDDPKAKKYYACIWIESKCIDKNGKLNIPLLQQLEPDHVKGKKWPVYAGCATKVNVTNESFEDKMYDVAKCIHKANPYLFVA